MNLTNAMRIKRICDKCEVIVEVIATLDGRIKLKCPKCNKENTYIINQ